MSLQPYSAEPTFEQRMGAAYEAGRKAKSNGDPLTACPHEQGTPAHTEWQNGWQEATARKSRRRLSEAA